MFILRSLVGSFIPTAHAGLRDGLGSNPALTKMWDEICSVMPCHLSGPGGTLPVVLALRVADFITKVIGGAAALVLLYAAIKVILSQGKDEGISEGRKIAMYALLGVILAIISDSVILFVLSQVGRAAVGN